MVALGITRTATWFIMFIMFCLGKRRSKSCDICNMISALRLVTLASHLVGQASLRNLAGWTKVCQNDMTLRILPAHELDSIGFLRCGLNMSEQHVLFSDLGAKGRTTNCVWMRLPQGLLKLAKILSAFPCRSRNFLAWCHLGWLA